MRYIFGIVAVIGLLAPQIAHTASPEKPHFYAESTELLRRLPADDEPSSSPSNSDFPLTTRGPESTGGPPCSPAGTSTSTPIISGCRANLDGDAMGWMRPYLDRAARTPENAGSQPPAEVPGLPAEFAPWWHDMVRQLTGMAAEELPVGVDWLVQSALRYSPHIQAVSAEPHIRRTMLIEEQAEFDWHTYLNSTYDDLNDPVGNTLTTGNNDDRFKDRNWSANGGLRRRGIQGGQFEASQRLGRQANNSRFLLPNPQATTRFELNYSQPLLNGSGQAYNQSRIVLASVDADTADDALLQELQEHLLQVTQAYWELYRSRAEFLQRKNVFQEALAIQHDLEGRQQVDSLERQILRAKAAVANRGSDIARAVTSIRNAESQLRLLVNDPALLHAGTVEFTPCDAPARDVFIISISDGLNTALVNRPDISKAIRNMRSTTTRLGVARNEILPKLDLLVSTYVAGLEGDSRVFTALGNQFSDGRPGYTVGLQFDTPLGNRAAHARLERRHWELQQATSQFRSTVERSLTETELAIREVHTTYREMVGKFESMHAADSETRYLVDRWKTLPGLDDSTTLLLEDLLDSQERRADEELEFVRTQVNYSVSLVRVRKAMGTLLVVNETISPADSAADAPAIQHEPLPSPSGP